MQAAMSESEATACVASPQHHKVYDPLGLLGGDAGHVAMCHVKQRHDVDTTEVRFEIDGRTCSGSHERGDVPASAT
jgi:hypothetical protein